MSIRRRLRAGEHAAEERLEEIVGGPARLHVVLVLGCVLALNTADQATVGAVGSELERGLGIHNTALGILAAVAPIMGALGAFPAGALVDRIDRTRLLAVAVVVWSAAMLVSAFSVDYTMLLLVRVALGLVTATAGPVVASLTGDFFPASERGRIYGFVLAGELLGAALGFAVTGEIAGALSWRWSFGVLAAPGFALALWVMRTLPEPARGGQSRLETGATEIVAAEDAAEGEGGADAVARDDALAERAVARQHVEPDEAHVLREDPEGLGALAAFRYVLSIPSNRLMILSSALGYFFLEGLETFAVIFLQRQYGVAHSLATLLLALIVVVAIGGAVAGGRIADRRLARGHINARITISAVAYVVAAVVLVPAFALASLGVALVFYLVGALAVAAPNPPLDAARLDIMPARLWGRAEGVRTLLRNFAQGLAPFLFGFISDQLVKNGSSSGASGFGAGASGRGLQETFLIMLVPLLLSGLLMFRVRREYPRDVATAVASEQALAEAAG